MASQTSSIHELVFSAFGTTAAVSAEDPQLAEMLLEALPPGAELGVKGPPAVRFGARIDEEGLVVLERDDEPLPGRFDAEVAITLLAERILTAVASRAEALILVRGAAVAYRGRAIVLPGASVSGTTTLHDALVDGGASTLSDGIVMLDQAGRTRGLELASAFEIGLIAVAPYRRGAHWDPPRGTAGDGALALLAHALTEREPARLLEVLGQAAANALVLEAERGEAGGTAEALLDSLRSGRVADA